ncbi:MAG TPA: sulfotransferase domain-containing protein, partial [Ktedonobacteraceae bacterium]|nr:sulfotransferase domain-containing protein [Ktedonobacteraceae bacterium]
SPYYIFHPYAAKRLAAYLPNVKLLVLLRNPIERAFSHYTWEVSWGNETLSFEDAIAAEEERIKVPADDIGSRYHFNHQHFSYISRGLYADQLEKWFSIFPREQFLILKSEDMYEDAAAIFKQTIEFLNVPYSVPKALKEEYKQYNKPKIAAPKKMDPAVRERLVAYYEPHNARLYELLGRDFGWK